MSKRHSRRNLMKCINSLANKYSIPHDSRWLCTIKGFIEEHAERFEAANLEFANDSEQRIKQLEINCNWLIGITDSICMNIAPGFIGTWQERANMALQKSKELR